MPELTDVLKREQKAAKKCRTCLKKVNKKARDHCQCLGLYRGAACNDRNLKYQIPDHTPIVFHNLNGYDAHLFIRELGKMLTRMILEPSQQKNKKCISFIVEINVEYAGVTNKEAKKSIKNI